MKLTIVVPSFNEEDALKQTTAVLRDTLDDLQKKNKISIDSAILFVDDGSTDSTWNIIQDFSRKFTNVQGITLANNVGHQNALLAGLMTADGDALISIDADLQDDTRIMENMIDEYRENDNEVVFGVRKKRNTDKNLKRITALAFYKLMNMMGVKIVYNHADYRLMGRRAIESLREYPERNLFLRGVVTLIGFKSTVVEYDRSARVAGTSKYPFTRMMALALDGITSFSVVPLRFITAFGFIIFVISVSISGWALASALFTDKAVPGWASTVLPIYFIGGVQILCLGVIGEYIGKIYSEVKQRPRYNIVKKTEE